LGISQRTCGEPPRKAAAPESELQLELNRLQAEMMPYCSWRDWNVMEHEVFKRGLVIECIYAYTYIYIYYKYVGEHSVAYSSCSVYIYIYIHIHGIYLIHTYIYM
jgi:hypothetical protein